MTLHELIELEANNQWLFVGILGAFPVLTLILGLMAGKKAATPFLFAEVNESIRAYGAPKHRHLSEIEQELSLAADCEVKISFVPHLMPINAGITKGQTCTHEAYLR